jgi:hypothetical protein
MGNPLPTIPLARIAPFAYLAADREDQLPQWWLMLDSSSNCFICQLATKLCIQTGQGTAAQSQLRQLATALQV